jgi:DNA polymerase-3 subunit gamma/tau
VAYVVLARKYRPLRFADLVGQEHVTRTLTRAIEHERVHHAYLFAGGRGLGKTTTARILARALVCERGPTADPCNECVHCRAVLDGSSADVIEIDGASTNKVEHVRSLREQVHYLPQFARRKIYIIDEVHMLSTAAFNALLKTLEEPPAHVNFVLATTEAHKLLATILSRVSRLDFRRLGVAGLVRHLSGVLAAEGLAMSPGALAVVARAAGGSVRDAMTALDQVIAFTGGGAASEADARSVLGLAGRESVDAVVDAILARDAATMLHAFEVIVAAGQDLPTLAVQILEQLRDLAVVKACGFHEDLVDATPEERERLEQRCARAEGTVLAQLFDRFAEIVDALATARAPKAVLEMGLLDLVQAEPLVPLGDLVERLGALERGGPTPGPAGGGGGTHRGTPVRGPGPAGPARGAAPAGASRSGDAAPRAASPPAAPSDPVPGSALGDRLWHLARRQGVFAGELADGTPPPSAESPPAAPTLRLVPAPLPTPPDAPQPERGDDDDTSCEPCLPAGVVPRDRIVVDLAAPFPAWRELVARIRETHELAGAVLAEAGVITFGAAELRLAVARGSFAASRLVAGSDVRATLQQALRDHVGGEFALELCERPPRLEDAPSLELVLERERAEAVRAAQEAARSHPGVQTLLATFEARLEDVRPLDS